MNYNNPDKIFIIQKNFVEKILNYANNLPCHFINLTTKQLNTQLPATSGKLKFFKFFYNLLDHHYSQHCYEPQPMLSVNEFMKSLNKNQFVLKIIVQTENFKNQEYPHTCHIHFDDDRLQLTDCKIATKYYLFIVDGTTESGQEVRLSWGDQHFELLKNTEPCETTIREFEKLKQQLDGEKCININDLHTVYIVVAKKTTIARSEPS